MDFNSVVDEKLPFGDALAVIAGYALGNAHLFLAAFIPPFAIFAAGYYSLAFLHNSAMRGHYKTDEEDIYMCSDCEAASEVLQSIETESADDNYKQIIEELTPEQYGRHIGLEAMLEVRKASKVSS